MHTKQNVIVFAPTWVTAGGLGVSGPVFVLFYLHIENKRNVKECATGFFSSYKPLSQTVSKFVGGVLPKAKFEGHMTWTWFPRRRGPKRRPLLLHFACLNWPRLMRSAGATLGRSLWWARPAECPPGRSLPIWTQLQSVYFSWFVYRERKRVLSQQIGHVRYNSDPSPMIKLSDGALPSLITSCTFHSASRN